MSEYIISDEQIAENQRLKGRMLLVMPVVVRCRDCTYSIHFLHHDDERWQCTEPHQEGDDVEPDAYCWRGKRKDGDAE